MNLKQEWLRLLGLAVLLPIAISLMDQWAAVQCGHDDSIWTVGAVYAIFVAQVGLVGWAVGRWLPQPVLCWTIYAWLISLVDVWVFFLAIGPRYGYESQPLAALPYALISAQIGMLAIWAVLGAAPWQWRLPFTAVVAAIAGFFCLPLEGIDCWISSETRPGPAFFSLSSAIIVFVSLLFRLFGFRLTRLPQPGVLDPSADERAYLQFTIRDMLILTTAAVPLLVVAKGLDWVRLRYFNWTYELRKSP